MFMDADGFQSYLPEIILFSLARYGACVKGKESAEDGALRNESGGKRCAAAAGAGSVRIDEFESSFLEPAHVIDGGSLQMFCARLVHVDFESIHFQYDVAGLLFFVKVQPIREAGAAAAGHRHSKPVPIKVLTREQGLYLLNGLVRELQFRPLGCFVNFR